MGENFENQTGHSKGYENACQLSQNLWSEMSSAGNLLCKEAGPALQNGLKAAKDHPVEAMIGVGTLTLVGVGLAAESPAIIGLAGAGAVCGGLYEAGKWAISEVNKLENKAGLK